jgi:hypothetical protein
MSASDLARSNSLGDLAARIRTEHEAAGAAIKRGVQHAMAAGDLLNEAKAQLKHGQWLPWLKGNCAIPSRTARLYMTLARGRTIIEAQIGNVANFTMRDAAALLAEANARSEAFALLEDAGAELAKAERVKTLVSAAGRKMTAALAEEFTSGLAGAWRHICDSTEIAVRVGLIDGSRLQRAMGPMEALRIGDIPEFCRALEASS